MNLTSPFTADRPLVPYVLILSSIFAAAFLVGFVAAPLAGQHAVGSLKAFADETRNLSGGGLFHFILLHNVMTSLLMVGAGLLFGIIPTAATSYNGFMLGVVYRLGAQAFGYGGATMRVLPHGVFEIPAFLFAAAYGLWLGVLVVRRIQGKENRRLGYYVRHAFRRYFTIAFPLLVVAAAIETFLVLKVY